MDLTPTIQSKSDQLNADDLLAGARTFTVEKVSAGTPDQPVNVYLAESPGKPYKPSKSMRRVLVAVWGPKGEAYVGRRLTLFRNPDIKFGGIAVGGIEISHMSHMDGALSMPLTASRGKSRMFKVLPLKEQPQQQVDWLDAAKNAGSLDDLRALYTQAQSAGAPADVLQAIQAQATRFNQEEPTTEEGK